MSRAWLKLEQMKNEKATDHLLQSKKRCFGTHFSSASGAQVHCVALKQIRAADVGYQKFVIFP